jgi:hypothetical protein
MLKHNSMVFLIPWLKEFQSNPIEKMLDKYKDQSLMASRLYHACLVSNTSMKDKYPDDSDKNSYFLYDYFLNKKFNGSFHFFDYPILENINVISECSEKESRVHKQSSSIQFNPYVCNYLKPFKIVDLYRSNVLSKFNKHSEVTVPLGSIDCFCKKDFHHNPIIVLDEPHSWTVRKIKKDRRKWMHPIEGECQDVYSYYKAIEICQILQSRYFKIKTFSTRSNMEVCQNDFDSKNGHWIPYLEMLKLYSTGSMFFSHYQETHGFSAYDNLQMGNAVIMFEENFNPFVINQFQNGVKLSLRMNSELCADMIQRYFEEIYKEFVFKQIQSDSFLNFSCDTYIERLCKSIIDSKIDLC